MPSVVAEGKVPQDWPREGSTDGHGLSCPPRCIWTMRARCIHHEKEVLVVRDHSSRFQVFAFSTPDTGKSRRECILLGAMGTSVLPTLWFAVQRRAVEVEEGALGLLHELLRIPVLQPHHLVVSLRGSRVQLTSGLTPHPLAR